MKNQILSAVAGLLGLAFHLDAQVPQLLTYQGRVAVGASNFNGTGLFRFALVNSNGSQTYWSNDGASVAGSPPLAAVPLPVVRGLYSVLLGDTMLPIPTSVFENPDVRLRVWFDDGVHGSQLLTPDHRLAAVGYAVMAANVPDGTITGAKIAAGAVGAAQLGFSAVQSGNIAAGAVGSAQLGAGAAAVNLNAGGTVTLPALSVSTSANPAMNAAAALGTTALGWSELHLASGGQINWANGNTTLTHSSGVLTVSTGDLRVTTPGTDSASVLTVGSTQTVSGKSISGSSNTLSNIELTSLAPGAASLGQVAAWNGTSWVPTNERVGDRAVVDFRQLPDGPATSTRTTEGEFVNFASNSADNYTISNGEMYCTEDTADWNVFYCKVRLPAPVRHVWCVVRFDSFANLKPSDNGGLLLIDTEPGGGAQQYVVHDGFQARDATQALGHFASGTYSVPGAVPGPNYTTAGLNPYPGYTFPGRTVRFDVVYFPETGLRISYVDGVPVGSLVIPECVGLVAKVAGFEGSKRGVFWKEFGASTTIPAGLHTGNNHSSYFGYTPLATATTTWQKLYTFNILYPASGLVEILASPVFNLNSNELFMSVGPSSGSAPDDHGQGTTGYKVASSPFGVWGGAINFVQLRKGQPFTHESVSIFVRTSSFTATHDAYGEGPRVNDRAAIYVVP